MSETTATITPQPTKITFRHQRLLDALLVDSDVQAARKTAGVGRSTAHRWLDGGVFIRSLVVSFPNPDQKKD
jgi:hypothetical protein